MEEIISLIYHGCNLAKLLELNLPNIANQPNALSNSCDDIIKVFISIKERLNSSRIQRDDSTSTATPTATTMFFGEAPPEIQQLQRVDEGLDAWLRVDKARLDHLLGLSSGTGSSDRPIMVSTQGATEVFGHSVNAELVDSGRGLSLQRTRRTRAGGVDRRTMRVAAPRMGNTEIAPDDGYTWRKYGQKEILGSTFPRGYYRCTHQKLYQCPAKKQVQRLDEDPYTFEVTYRGDHTCTMSSTAPSTAPQAMQTTVAASDRPIGSWLAMELRPPSSGGDGQKQLLEQHMQVYPVREFGQDSSGAGPSRVPFGGQVDYNQLPPVVDMADAMFNYGSGSSNNSMELIFSAPNMEDNEMADRNK